MKELKVRKLESMTAANISDSNNNDGSNVEQRGDLCVLTDDLLLLLVDFIGGYRRIDPVTRRKHVDVDEAALNELLQQREEILVCTQTLCTLRLVSHLFADYLAPRRTDVWKNLILSHFDFSTADDPLGNEFQQKLGELLVTGAPVHDSYLSLKREEAERATRDSLRLRSWPQIGVAFRPCQYGFLEAIQTGRQRNDEWPSNEDPFTLYKDLVCCVRTFGPVARHVKTTSRPFVGAAVLIGGENGADVGYCVGHHAEPDNVDRDEDGFQIVEITSENVVQEQIWRCRQWWFRLDERPSRYQPIPMCVAGLIERTSTPEDDRVIVNTYAATEKSVCVQEIVRLKEKAMCEVSLVGHEGDVGYDVPVYDLILRNEQGDDGSSLYRWVGIVAFVAVDAWDEGYLFEAVDE